MDAVVNWNSVAAVLIVQVAHDGSVRLRMPTEYPS